MKARPKDYYDDVVSMRQSGFSYQDVARAVPIDIKQIREIARRARNNGDLPQAAPRKERPLKVRYGAIARHLGVGFGNLGSVMAERTTEDVLRAVILRAADEGYLTLAEYAVDLMLDDILNDGDV